MKKNVWAGLALSLSINIGCASFAYSTPVPEASSTTEEKLTEQLADSMVTARVKAALLTAKHLKSAEIHVKTEQGTVYLTGYLSSEADKNTAVTMAKNVEGVKQVKDLLQVK